MQFTTPGPQPGGQTREYWIGARTVSWDIAPTGRDEWMNHRVPSRRRRKMRAYVYQEWSAASPTRSGRARMPGPTLYAEVGDVIVVHFSNLDRKLQPGGHDALARGPLQPRVRRRLLGDFTRAGGFVAPGEEFTYVWEATPDSVGVWPYHDHGPNHTLNTLRGLFGAVIVRAKGAPAPDVERVLFLHSFPPQVTGFDGLFQCFNGRSYAGNTPTIRARVGPARGHPRDRHGPELPHLPHPRPPLAQQRRRARGLPDGRSERDDHGKLRGRQSRAVALPLPCRPPQDSGMAGWYLVEE